MAQTETIHTDNQLHQKIHAEYAHPDKKIVQRKQWESVADFLERYGLPKGIKPDVAMRAILTAHIHASKNPDLYKRHLDELDQWRWWDFPPTNLRLVQFSQTVIRDLINTTNAIAELKEGTQQKNLQLIKNFFYGDFNSRSGREAGLYPFQNHFLFPEVKRLLQSLWYTNISLVWTEGWEGMSLYKITYTLKWKKYDLECSSDELSQSNNDAIHTAYEKYNPGTQLTDQELIDFQSKYVAEEAERLQKWITSRVLK